VRYRTVLADPPWDYERRAVGGATPGSYGPSTPFPYGTLGIDELAGIPVRDFAERDLDD
jgi:hypothetical protein